MVLRRSLMAELNASLVIGDPMMGVCGGIWLVD